MGGGASISGKEDVIVGQTIQTNAGPIVVKDYAKIKAEEKSISNSIRSRSSVKSSGPDGRRKSQIVVNQAGVQKIVTWFEDEDEGLSVGDVVKVNFKESEPLEGFVVEKLNDVNILVDFGDHIKECHVSNCTLLIRSDELEVGDKVEMKPADSALYFVGIISAINDDFTCDIQMDGDDPDDIERNVELDCIRKLMSKRALVVGRWRRAFMAVRATKKFNKFGFAEEYGEAKTDSFHYDV